MNLSLQLIPYDPTRSSWLQSSPIGEKNLGSHRDSEGGTTPVTKPTLLHASKWQCKTSLKNPGLSSGELYPVMQFGHSSCDHTCTQQKLTNKQTVFLNLRTLPQCWQLDKSGVQHPLFKRTWNRKPFGRLGEGYSVPPDPGFQLRYWSVGCYVQSVEHLHSHYWLIDWLQAWRSTAG